MIGRLFFFFFFFFVDCFVDWLCVCLFVDWLLLLFSVLAGRGGKEHAIYSQLILYKAVLCQADGPL